MRSNRKFNRRQRNFMERFPVYEGHDYIDGNVIPMYRSLVELVTLVIETMHDVEFDEENKVRILVYKNMRNAVSDVACYGNEEYCDEIHNMLSQLDMVIEHTKFWN